MYEKIQKQREENAYGKEREIQKEQGHIPISSEDIPNPWKLRRNKYKKDRYGHILGEIIDKAEDILTSNPFDVLNQEQQEISNTDTNESTKDWVNRSFGKGESTDVVQNKKDESTTKEIIE
ncbi:hypothetical protein FXO38_07182 [Capsicum annuum]|nr:hypothetical protein FXO38_07182 [Capsicum annuum]KAF3672349.1 hypothetical protein FXO37_07557 [Capsicum annuum]